MSEKIRRFLTAELHYSNYQVKLLRYICLTILSESSKMILMGIVFFYLGYFKEYAFAVSVLCLLRLNTGGIHLKHYVTCFLMTFSVMLSAVYLLPMLPMTKLMQMILLLLCLAANQYAAPVLSSYRPVPDGMMIKKAKVQSAVIICLYIVVLYVLPESSLLTSGFWSILLQSAQLAVAKLITINTKRREQTHEINRNEVDVYTV